MSEGLQGLSEREKETLRLLLGGHDAKSIARSLGLSIHTVNERLRDARRKLGVASSREAARQLAEVERNDPNSLVDKQLGVAGAVTDRTEAAHPDRRGPVGQSLVWFSGGMLIMSLIIAAAVLSSAFHRTGEPQSPPTSEIVPAATTPSTFRSPGAISASAWVSLLDQRRWGESWDAAGALFKSQVEKARWASTIQPLRQQLGQVSSRTVQNATRTTSLPGVPAGDYEIVEFRTNFAQKHDAVETVVMVREGSSWKVNGYFIR
ncbi:LuxR family transcriptional regulator [Sphingomonas sp. Leaf339]|uniref:helix-turn-helix domain-containing protein n=1 Tax=Sphingomonas sp. Leaf339 TaxID=1736343 RepID=UPI0006F32811|nr:DUF4019 domain-containing protein [Sphingomonas sp. Leaf339]KQU61911.1 LuxR family transcriptional regulator [Sphingomonas sp. Leaf339]